MDMRCRNCNRIFEINPQDAGREMECPFCRNVFICPKSVASVLPPIPPAPPMATFYNKKTIERSVSWIVVCTILLAIFGLNFISAVLSSMFINRLPIFAGNDITSMIIFFSFLFNAMALFLILGICSFFKYLIRK